MDPLQENNPLNRIRDIGYLQRLIADRVVKDVGITVEQGGMLGMVDALTQRTGHAPAQKDVAALSRTTPASITSLVKGMEAKGLLERRSDPDDARIKTLHLLPRGAEIMAGFDRTMRAVQTSVLESLTADETQTLMHLLDRLHAVLAEESNRMEEGASHDHADR